jgi:hypothetical protein
VKVRWTPAKKGCVNVLVDDDSDPGCISEENKTIHADLFISLRCRENLVRLDTAEHPQQRRTSLQVPRRST